MCSDGAKARGVTVASEGRAEPRLEAHRAEEEVLTGEGKTEEQQDVQFGRTGGTRTRKKMPPKKICIVGSGNWWAFFITILDDYLLEKKNVLCSLTMEINANCTRYLKIKSHARSM